MKKLLVVIGLALAVPLWAEGYNLLLNPGFERWDTSSTGQDSMPKYWHLYIKSGVSGSVAKVLGYEGFGVKIAVTGNASGYDASFYHFVNGIDTLPFANDTFLVSIWVKENSANISGRLYCSWQNASGSNVRTDSSNYSANSPDWQEISFKTVRPADAVTFKYEFRIYKGATTEDSIYLDNAYFGLLVLSASERVNFDLRVPEIVFNSLPVEFSVNRALNINISLYGADGRKIRDLYSGMVNGTYKNEFSMKELKSGVYFVDVREEGVNRQYKVIKF